MRGVWSRRWVSGLVVATCVLAAPRALADNLSNGIGKIFDTGASLGFAEFFASLINWSKPGPSTQADFDNMNRSLDAAIASAPGMQAAIPRWAVPPPPPQLSRIGKDVAAPYTRVQGWRSAFYGAISKNNQFGGYFEDFFELGASLAIAEGQCNVAKWLPASVHYCKQALDTAVARATGLVNRKQVTLDLATLQSIQKDVSNFNVSTARDRIVRVREAYARAIYAGAKLGAVTVTKPTLVVPDMAVPK